MDRFKLAGNSKFLRFQNTDGKIIPLHHAFKTIELDSKSRMSAILLPVLFEALVWVFLPQILNVWALIIAFWTSHIYGTQVGYEPQFILGQLVFIPYPFLDAQLPTDLAVWVNLLICILGFILSFIFPPRAKPITYLIRTVLLIQGSASIDRITSPAFFPYTLKTYVLDATTLCVYMLFVIPPLLGMIYYIFDFSIWRKLLLTGLMIVYYLFFIPCQYTLHAYFIHEYSLLVLPLMYIFFGVVIDVLTFVSIYAYGMSWKSQVNAMHGRHGR